MVLVRRFGGGKGRWEDGGMGERVCGRRMRRGKDERVRRREGESESERQERGGRPRCFVFGLISC